ncbi:aldehyde-activating protein [Duganella caerulea]|uniref:GFA family protein n=1 Tax=Duganella caerulea TaxID=2885762 RepID=UPI0030EABCFE
MMRTYQGSCHCGAVRFEADVDLAHGTLRCNCSFCLKIRCWAVMAKPEAFRLLAGEGEMSVYQFGAKNEHHYFCKHCGVRPYGVGNSPRYGVFYGVNVASLDGVSDEDFANAPITYVDGRADNWISPPTETRYL